MPGYPVQRPQVRHNPQVTNPPTRGGTVRPVKRKNGAFTRRGIYIEK